MSEIDYQSVPPWLLMGEIPGTEGTFTSFANLAALQGDGLVGDGSGWNPPFGPQSYVVLGDAAQATWDGSAWTLWSSPFSMPIPIPGSLPVGDPTPSWTKAQIIEWLGQNGVLVDEKVLNSFTKVELLQIVEWLLDVDIDNNGVIGVVENGSPLPPIDEAFD